jgi:hypothetical protein
LPHRRQIVATALPLDRQADRTHHQWETHHGAGERGTGPAKRKNDFEVFIQESAERPLTAGAAAKGIPLPLVA